MKYCPVVKGHDIRSVRQNTLFCSASFGPWTLQSRTFSSLLLSPGRTVPTSCRAAALQVTFTFLHMEVQSPPAAPKTWDPSQFKSRFGQKKNNQCGCRDLTEAKGSESLQKCDVFHGVIHSIWAACSLLTKRQEPEQLHGGPGSISSLGDRDRPAAVAQTKHPSLRSGCPAAPLAAWTPRGCCVSVRICWVRWDTGMCW